MGSLNDGLPAWMNIQVYNAGDPSWKDPMPKQCFEPGGNMGQLLYSWYYGEGINIEPKNWMLAMCGEMIFRTWTLLGPMTAHASFLRDFRHVTWTDGGRIHEASKRMVPAGSSCSKQLDVAATKDQAPPSSELLWCPPSGNQTWWWETHY